MKWVKIISFLGVLAMTAVLFYGFTQGNFFEDGGKLMQNPWGIVSLVDLYTGFILFAVWIVYRETGILSKIFWVLILMILGFFTASLYMLLAAYQSKGDLMSFVFGSKKDQVLSKYRP
ncbi:DUF1475 family protein [Proteiniclasticum ruminis]|uniref:DUF1475 family protein n=1 Tax=Proteiniclasticum ruminis TaxID=398199 RepID=UPI00289B58AE|nr:DUF1475 family protein [Proteiniclasticum ruminis]